MESGSKEQKNRPMHLFKKQLGCRHSETHRCLTKGIDETIVTKLKRKKFKTGTKRLQFSKNANSEFWENGTKVDLDKQWSVAVKFSVFAQT